MKVNNEVLEKFFKILDFEESYFEELPNKEKIKIENLKILIKRLKKYNYEKHELRYILRINPSLFYLSEKQVEEIEKVIDLLEEYGDVREVIYANPLVLNKKSNEIKDSVEFLKEYMESSDNAEELLDENVEIYTLSKETLQKSFEEIERYLKDKQKVKKLVNEIPVIIGITDINAMLKYIF